jgi:acetyltransferase-like isoleucine patch superfamily enzyme
VVEKQVILLIIIFLIIFVFMIKLIFNVFAYFISFLFFSFVRKNIKTNNSPDSTKKIKNSIKTTISKYVNGLIFYSILQTGKIHFHFFRNMLYRYIFKVKMGRNVVVYGGVEIRSPNNLFIGNGSIIGHYNVLDARNVIEIGENVNFSHGVWLWTEQHNHKNLDFSCDSENPKKIKICDRVWLGPRVIVLPGCTVGEGAVVGAGAIITKDIEPFSINVGVPAKKIGERNRHINYVFNGNPMPFV